VCEALGVVLHDIPDWSCCGSTPAHTVDHVLSAALSARNLAQAETLTGVEGIATPCPSCLTNLKTAGRRMLDPQFKERVNSLLDTPVKQPLPAKSVLQVLFEDVGPAALKERVVKPLAGLKVAPYYGCILNRPPEVMEFDDCENPIAMDRLLEALGAEVVPFPLKVECCGASFGMPRKDMVMRLSGKLLDVAEDNGAMAMATACPLCQMNLDLRQSQINATSGKQHNMPVFYYTQLIGLALGLDKRLLGLNKLCVNPKAALQAAEQATAGAA
jgi:heterodisulfide reductase subunit B